MEDRPTLPKAIQELVDIYSGIPDESVDLTFKDLVVAKQNGIAEKNLCIKEVKDTKENPPLLRKSVDIDFARSSMQGKQHHRTNDDIRQHRTSPSRSDKGLRSGLVYNNGVSTVVSRRSTSPYRERCAHSRPGIPHTNICTVCSRYIHFFRHRCLVCGRAYCRQCVRTGMGERTEGRKCIECIGKRFSPRYIERAGDIGCCIGYPSAAKQQELRWAEKGPRRSGEKRYGRSMIASTSISPIGSPTKNPTIIPPF